MSSPALDLYRRHRVDNDYVERAESVVLPKVSSAILTELIDASRQLKTPRLAPPGGAWARSS